MIYPTQRLITALALCLLTLPVGSVLGSPNPAKWAPKESIVYLGIPNCDELSETAKKTAAFRMAEDPAVKDSIQPWKNIGKKVQGIVAKRLGLDNPKELEVYPHGGLAFFMTVDAPAGENKEPQPHIAAVMDMGKDLERIQRLTKVITNKCLENGAKKKNTEYTGGEITTIEFPKKEPATDPLQQQSPKSSDFVDEIMDAINSEDLGGQEMIFAGLREELLNMETPEEFSFGYLKNILVIADNLDTIKTVFKQIKKGVDGSLAGDPAMRLLKTKCDSKAELQFIVNIPKITSMVSQEDAEAKTFIQALGINDFGPLVATVKLLPTPKLETRWQAFLEIKDSSSGLGKILMMPNTITAAPAGVGSDALFFASANINPGTILSEVIKITTKIDPADGEQMQASMKVPMENGSVLDIQKDIVNHFTGPVFGSFTASKPYAPENLNVMLALGHKSREACDRMIALIPPGMLNGTEMMGSMIYDLPPMIPIMGLAGGLTDRSLIPVGTKAAVENYIRTEGRSNTGISDDPMFKKLLKEVPAKCCAILYADNIKSYEAQLAISKTTSFTDQPPLFLPAGNMLQWQLSQGFIGKKLANPEALRKYQRAAISTVTTESDGLRFDGAEMLADN